MAKPLGWCGQAEPSKGPALLTLSPHHSDAPLSILCCGAHSDDSEIGCGGTILTLLDDPTRSVNVHWIVLSARDERRAEALASAEALLARATTREVSVCDFADRYFPSQRAELKEWFDALGRRISPDLIFTHRRDDRHQDHALVAELVWNTFRDHMILEYEIPKYEGDLGHPNVFVPLSGPTCTRKVAHLSRFFASQRDRFWFSDDTFRALLRLRGIEARSPSGYAEAFHGPKLSLSMAVRKG